MAFDADLDLDDIWNHIAQNSIDAADRLILDDLARTEQDQGTYDKVPDDFNSTAIGPISESSESRRKGGK